MGNENNQGIVTLQGFAALSMPLDVALVGLQASHSYCPTLKTLTDLLVTLPIVCNTFKTPPQCCLLFVMSCIHLWPLLIICNNPSQSINFYFQVFPFFLLPHVSYYFPMVASNLLFKRLPFSMQPCFSFQKKRIIIMKKGQQHIVYS